ncbi:hypothetical protein NEMBOFW57_001131 [Staphylotrichum longicolle]|uniref:F-box domain-containing protein n=1 Tax=Staphylotrichum longicolle TaxID=669026 RepID=A0AAD4I1G5_9PEZI|nr:hypothetical protein NEMBOFW57_001131 [Staphylotrichum longicolle]
MPLEILTEIASNLTYSSSSLEGLSRLGRTCRALFIVVTPVLYRHIHLSLPLYPMLARCARSLVTCPARCEHIQSINIRRIYKDRYYTKSDREVLDEIVQPLFGIHAFEPKRFGNVDLAIMAVICLAQNLETLEISHFYESSGNTDSLLQEVNNRVRQRSACTLSKLTTLTFKPPSKKAKINLDKLNGLLNAAPNLQSLHIDAATGGSSLAVSLTNLTTLCLEDSHLGYQGLRLLTQPCVNLTYFKFAHFKGFDEPAWRPFSAAQILDCLKPCSAQLQHLHLEPLARLVDYVIEDEDEPSGKWR